MYYYEVWVSSPKYHGDSGLTYSSSDTLAPGQIVTVPLQRHQVAAIVIKQVPKPAFKTKAITRCITDTPLPQALLQLIAWTQNYYPAPLGQIVSLVLPSMLVQSPRRMPETTQSTDPMPLPPLTEEQSQAVQHIQSSYPRSILLHGDTGTGKTRVYLELIRSQFARNKSVIVLTPEIGLTPQLALTCEQSFPGQTVVLHSNLTPAQRRTIWLRILHNTRPLIVVGPRSALFAPLPDIGLIIIDESHDTAYKQEQAPHYLTSRMAAHLATLHDAQLLLGSATPLVADYYTFEQKALPIIRMRQPAVQNVDTKTDISLIDLKNRDNFTRSPWIADALLTALEENLRAKEQSLLFLNRRGTARLVLCQTCGWQAHCPRCDLPLTYHGDSHRMRCHTCGFASKTPLACPECSESNIIFRAIGTKSLVTELEKLFPEARIMRFDSDTAKSERLESQFKTVKTGAVDILVGTQILGKGLDLPRLSLLGVILADTALSFPDFTAEEQTFQLLTQVIGRVSRGHIAGSVFLQTHHGKNPVLQAAVRKDYATFYAQQLAERQQFMFPPFCYLLKLSCVRASSASAKKASDTLADQLRNTVTGIEINGPSPAFVEKTRNRYKWQLIIKSRNRHTLVQLCKQLPAGWSYDLDPTNLL